MQVPTRRFEAVYFLGKQAHLLAAAGGIAVLALQPLSDAGVLFLPATVGIVVRTALAAVYWLAACLEIGCVVMLRRRSPTFHLENRTGIDSI